MTEVKKKRGRPKGSGLIGINRLLTRKQELFVKELVSKDGQITKRQAAINAGYPEGSAHSKAYDLTNPKDSPSCLPSYPQISSRVGRKIRY